ncbi:MAG: glycosyltransferase family 2 protein [Synergistaceae bacterium]|jgi:glycosyltransferase involved in cell wall biosynthesis|nr:glycosyltransferase family 2 protein [Synergistaceae bacterium]
MGGGGGVVVAIPCYNEERTIAKVVSDFRRALPEARVIVFDNRSTDMSAKLAVIAGAEVIYVGRRGKGAVLRHLFREIDADVYLTADGDDACPADTAKDLISPILNGDADMAIGDRISGGGYKRENRRKFHNFGNELVSALVNGCFGAEIRDVMCGYRAFSRRLAVNVPILSDGFEVETEMTVKCLERKLAIAQIPIPFRDRTAGTQSKLRTFRDGIKVLHTIASTLKNYKPLAFFGTFGLMFACFGLFCGAPIIMDFVRTGGTPRVPLSVLAAGLELVAMTFFICAFILDTMIAYERSRNEMEILKFGDRE